MKKRLVISAVVLAASLIYIMLYSFVEDIRRIRPEISPSDAIVVLTGGYNRAEEGLRLLREGVADTLILSGVNRDADTDSIYQLSGLTEAERGSIILEKNSRSTFENAVEVGKLVRAGGYTSIVLLTSTYHMKRALAVFKHVMPPGVEIKTWVVSTPNFNDERWWEGNTLTILTLEFVKYYWYEASFLLAT